MPLAFLNLGPSELALLVVLFLLLFGADRIPELARSLGRAKAELEKAQRQVQDSLKTEEERALEEQLAFERLRETQMRAQVEDPEYQAIVRAADELGIQTAGRSADELRAAIGAKLSASTGERKDPENSAATQQ